MPTTRDAEGFLTHGGVRLLDLARDPQIGTPAYVYDLDAIAAGARRLVSQLDGYRALVAYAVKANSAGAIVRALSRSGCGADVVSGGELLLARGAGVAPDRIVFSGVGKTRDEIDLAIHEHIRSIQAESIEEIAMIEARASAAGRVAPIAVRVNPGLAAESVGTHAHITTGHDDAKFGVPTIDLPYALALAARSPHVALVGLASHVGSQLTSTGPYVAAARALFEVARRARADGAKLAFVDAGGGFGIDYEGGEGVPPADYVRAARAAMVEAGLGDLDLVVEPGRALVAAHGVLLSSVIREKVTPHDGSPPRRAWLVVDAGMNDLIRPALYQARHRVVSLDARGAGWSIPHRVVGPVCESSDDFGDHHGLRGATHVALLDAGAYGFSMASRYNGRPLPAEVFLQGGRVQSVKPRHAVGDWVGDRA